jgi:serine/threonine protein kinase
MLDDFYIGRKIGNRYDIVEQIGNFSLGTMYLARSSHDQTPKEVALLLLHNCNEPSYEALKLHFSKQLKHAHIRNVFEFGRDEKSNQMFIAMETFDGEPLSALLTGRPFAMSFVSRLFEQICAGVKAAHDHGIVHGAIDPQNILVSASGDAEFVKLTNFGVLAILEDNQEIDDRAPEINYNPYYFSPEQIKGQKPDERSDVYALGCLLYEMLSGHPPYSEQKRSEFQVVFAKLTEQPIRLSDINPDISPALTEVVMKAISEDPLQRNRSVDDLLASFLSTVPAERK